MSLGKHAVWDGGQIPIIHYRGNFSWPGLYQMVREWIEKHHFKFQEKRYKHKGDELEIDFLGERKVDAMHMYHLHVYFHIFDFRENEIVEHGKKKPMNHARMEIMLDGHVEVDYSDRFGESKLGQTLGKWWQTITWKDIELKHIDPYTYEIYKLHEEIKKYLNITADSNAY